MTLPNPAAIVSRVELPELIERAFRQSTVHHPIFGGSEYQNECAYNKAWKDLRAYGQQCREGAGWRTMESAPRDGTYVLLAFPGRIEVGYWDDDRYGVKPNPLWVGSLPRRNVYREAPPTHWQPLPPVPQETTKP